MIAFDTNVLVAAHRADAKNHAPCLAALKRAAEGKAPYALFWPSLYEFLRVVTHHRVFNPPTPLADALLALGDFTSPLTVRVLAETELHDEVLRAVLRSSPVEGNLVHDAHLVALAVEHGVHEIVTYDHDFRRFSQVSVREP